MGLGGGFWGLEESEWSRMSGVEARVVVGSGGGVMIGRKGSWWKSYICC